jgi:hypothetical protein
VQWTLLFVPVVLPLNEIPIAARLTQHHASMKILNTKGVLIGGLFL